MLDLICQISIVILGIPAFLMVLRDSPKVQLIGAMLGTLTCPFWFATLYYNEQFIAILMQMVYTYGWVDKLMRLIYPLLINNFCFGGKTQ